MPSCNKSILSPPPDLACSDRVMQRAVIKSDSIGGGASDGSFLSTRHMYSVLQDLKGAF